MGDTPGRLLRLLSLLQTPRTRSGRELAERLGVDRRTVRRDVERLRDLGYPVDAVLGVEGGYRLAAGSALPPLLFVDDEALAIAVGLRSATGGTVAGLADAAVRALAKLEQVLPSRLRRRVSTLGAATVPLATGEAAPVDPDVLTTVAGAVATSERLRFAYLDAAGEPTRRHAEPYGLVPARQRWYVVAYDVDRADWRVYRADRMAEVRATGARFAARPLPAADAAAFVAERSYALAPTYEAVVTVALPAADVTRALGGAAAEVTPLGPRRCRLRLAGDTVPWLALRLIQLDADVTVHEPAELVDHLRAVAARLSRATR